MTQTVGGPYFICAVKGCRIKDIPQHVQPPMTGRTAFERHNRTNHPDQGIR